MRPYADLTRQAQRDLLEIWVFVAETNPQAADQLTDTLEASCQTLAEFPRMGRSRDDLLKGLRSMVEGQYLIFYREQEDGISVERIVHGARQIENMFPESEETEP